MKLIQICRRASTKEPRQRNLKSTSDIFEASTSENINPLRYFDDKPSLITSFQRSINPTHPTLSVSVSQKTSNCCNSRCVAQPADRMAQSWHSCIDYPTATNRGNRCNHPYQPDSDDLYRPNPCRCDQKGRHAHKQCFGTCQHLHRPCRLGNLDGSRGGAERAASASARTLMHSAKSAAGRQASR